MALPDSWTSLLDRLGRVLDSAPPEAEEWLREAVRASYGVESLHALDRPARAICFQKAAGVLLRLEEEGIPTELVSADGDLPPTILCPDGSLEPRGDYPGRRGQIARAFARYFAGVALDGPPWRLSDLEADRPSYDEWAASASF